MIFVGFLKKINLDEKITKIIVSKNIILKRSPNNSWEKKYYKKQKGNLPPNAISIIHNIPGTENQLKKLNLWTPYENIHNLTLAIRITSGGDCYCPLQFGVNDDKTTPPEETFWKILIHKNDDFTYFKHSSSYITPKHKSILKNVYRNIQKIGTEKNYTKLKNALDLYDKSFHEGGSLERLIYYCIILETLFSDIDENNEINYKISLRASFFLKKEPAEREDLFKFIREMYKLRGQWIHGNDYTKLANKTNIFFKGINEFDTIIRHILKKILSHDKYTDTFHFKITDGHNNSFNNYMNNLIIKP